MNVKLSQAIHVLDEMFIANERRKELMRFVEMGWVSPSDGWVSACLGCANDADIPSIAYEFFLADCKSGVYDVMPTSDPSEV